MNQNGNKRSVSFNPSMMKQSIAGLPGLQQQARTKSISIHRKSQILKANEEDISVLQSCYVSREDSVFQMRVTIMQIIENTFGKTPSEIQYALRQSCAAIISQESHRTAIEDAILVKYISKNAPLIYLDAKNTTTKMIIFRLCSRLNKINNAYFQKIQFYFPRLAELIQQEQCQWNSSFKEALSSLLALSQAQNTRAGGDKKQGISLDTVLSFITSRSRQRFQKEQTKFAGFPTSYFGLVDKTGSLPHQSDRSNKNEKFFLEKLVQNPQSFTYSRHLMIKYLIHHDKTGLPQSLCIQVSQFWKTPYDILNLDEGNSNNSSSSSSLAQSSSFSSMTKASISFESVWETIVSNYDKSIKEMFQANKSTASIIRAYHDQYSKWKQSQARKKRIQICNHPPPQRHDMILSTPSKSKIINFTPLTDDIQKYSLERDRVTLDIQSNKGQLNDSLSECQGSGAISQRFQDISREDDNSTTKKQEFLEFFSANSNKISNKQFEFSRPLTTDRRESDQISNPCFSNTEYPEFMGRQTVSRSQLSRVIVSQYPQTQSQRSSLSFSVKGEGFQTNCNFKNLNPSMSFPTKGKIEEPIAKQQSETKQIDLPSIKVQSERSEQKKIDSQNQQFMKSVATLPRGSILTYSKPELFVGKNIFLPRSSLQETDFSVKTDSLALPGTFFMEIHKSSIQHPAQSSADPCNNYGKAAQLDKAIALNSFHVPINSTTKSLQKNKNILMPQTDKGTSAKKNTSTSSIDVFKPYDFSSTQSTVQFNNTNTEKNQKRKSDLARDLLRFDDLNKEKQNNLKKEDKQLKYCNLNLDSSASEQVNQNIKQNTDDKNVEMSGISYKNNNNKINLGQKQFLSNNNSNNQAMQLYRTPKQAFLKYQYQQLEVQNAGSEQRQNIFQLDNNLSKLQIGQLKLTQFNSHLSLPQKNGLSFTSEETTQQLPADIVSPRINQKPQYAERLGRLSSQI